jgi:hypothetical protein
VQRSDGLFSLHQQARWPEEPSWTWPREIVDYRSADDEHPQGFAMTWQWLPGLFGTVDEAEAEARAAHGYNEASSETK